MLHWFKSYSIPTRITLSISSAILVLLAVFAVIICFYPPHNLNPAFFVLAVFLCTGMSICISVLIVRQLKASLQKLIRHIATLDKKQGAERFLPVEGNDEIGCLSRVFNELLQELDDNLAAQHEAAQLYKIITENTDEVAVWRLPDGSIRFISPNCQTVFGHLDAEFYADPDLIEKLIHPEDRKKWHEVVTSSKQPQEAVELRIRVKQGTVCWFLYNCHQIFDENGSLLGTRSSYLNITSQKVAQEITSKALELATAAKREWEETMDCINDVVILVNKENRIQRTNKRLSTLTGRDFTELIGNDWRELLKERGFRFSVFRNNSGEIVHEESGQLFNIFCYPIKYNDESGMVVTMHDVTELHRATLELQNAYDNLEKTQLKVFQQEKLASIGQLAAGVAHEINNPIGFISSNLSSLKKYGRRLDEYIAVLQSSLYSCSSHPDLSGLDSLRQKLKVDYIISDITQLIDESLDGMERVRKIVADLKSFSRVDEVTFTRANINDCLESTINIVWNELKYIADIDRQYSELPLLLCYPQQLNQVFMNLLVNAAHAIEGHGIITVKTDATDEHILISISDTGKGILPEHLERIFEPFFTTKEVGKGTGLGLSICYDIIRKHNGVIGVESEVGKGSTFTVRLPLAGPEAVWDGNRP